jgi:hypothetical protein
MQFTRISHSLLLLELHFCREALEKKNFFAMSPLGAVAGTGWPNSGEPRRGLAGGGLGKGLGVQRVWFGASDRAEWLRRWGASAAGGGGRRGLCCDAAEPRRGWDRDATGRREERGEVHAREREDRRL